MRAKATRVGNWRTTGGTRRHFPHDRTDAPPPPSPSPLLPPLPPPLPCPCGIPSLNVSLRISCACYHERACPSHSHGSHRGQAQRRKVHSFQSHHRTAALHRRGRTRHHARPDTWDCRTRRPALRADRHRGIVVHDQEYIPGQILRQAEVALKAPPTSSSWWTGAPKLPAAIAISPRCSSGWASPSPWRSTRSTRRCATV